jgi:hypothetical protein
MHSRARGSLTIVPELLGIDYTIAIDQGAAGSQGRVHMDDSKPLVGKAINDGPAQREPVTCMRKKYRQHCEPVSAMR